MIYLAQFLGGVFTYLFTFFAGFVAKKVALVLALVATWAAFAVATFTGINLLLDSMGVLGAPAIMQGFQYFLPSNLAAAVSGIISARFLVMVYQFDFGLVKMMAAA